MKDYSKQNRMTVDVIGEFGYLAALYGLSLSYGLSTSYKDFIDRDVVSRMDSVSDKLYNRDNGENKFLESITVQMDINAPRYWWQQFDTYRTGVTKQSGSTMHTIMKRELVQNDFIEDIDRLILEILNNNIRSRDFRTVKRHLPEGFMQRRQITTNYKSLRHICNQRKVHRLPEWSLFISRTIDQLEHPEYIGIDLQTIKE